MAKAGICTIVGREQSMRDFIQIASKAGAQGLEIWAKPPHVSYPMNEQEIDETRAFAEEHGVPVIAIGSYYRSGISVEQSGVPITKETEIAIAKQFGAKIIRVWAGDKDYGSVHEADRTAIIDDLRSFGDQAGKDGITVVLERHNNTLTNEWDTVAGLMDKINHPHVALNYQIPSPASKLEFETKSINDYTKLLPYSKHAHLQNYVSQEEIKWGERSFLDNGVVDYSKLPEAIAQANYDGFFMVEFLPTDREGLSELDTIKREIDFITSL